jgi:acyl-CoA thioesterase
MALRNWLRPSFRKCSLPIQHRRNWACELPTFVPATHASKMDVLPEMLNGHAICHGGLIFSLADSAFAFACNTHNFVTVAAGCSIEFLAPAHTGDHLVAEAVEQLLHGRAGVYDVTISNQNGQRIALFRGRSHRTRTEIISRETAERLTSFQL